jgi:hypothetical protein
MSQYWSNFESSRYDLVDAARVASEGYQLGNAIVYDQPEHGWEDERLESLAEHLLNFADLHAITAVGWPDGPPIAARPNRAVLDAHLADNGLDVWIGELLTGVSDVRSADEWIVRHRVRMVYPRTPLEDHLEPEDFTELRAPEQPDWADFARASHDTASIFRSAVRGHITLYRALEDPDAELAFLAMEAQRVNVATGIAWCRTQLVYLMQRGGQAEAILAANLAIRFTREQYLMISARSPAEFRDLDLLRPDEVIRITQADALANWASEKLGEPMEAYWNAPLEPLDDEPDAL